MMQFPSHHWSADFGFYLFYLLGQMLFVLKRTAFAVRSKTNPFTSRRQYLQMNWDILLIRLFIGVGIYYCFRHYDAGKALHYFFSSWRESWTIPINPISALLVGYVADSLIDYALISDKLPDFIKRWLKEQIPELGYSMEHTVEETKVQTTVQTTKETTKAIPPENQEEKPKD